MDSKWTSYCSTATWGPDGLLMDPKWTPNRSQMDPILQHRHLRTERTQKDPKWTPNGLHTAVPISGDQTDPKRSPNGPHTAAPPPGAPPGPPKDGGTWAVPAPPSSHLALLRPHKEARQQRPQEALHLVPWVDAVGAVQQDDDVQERGAACGIRMGVGGLRGDGGHGGMEMRGRGAQGHRWGAKGWGDVGEWRDVGGHRGTGTWGNGGKWGRGDKEMEDTGTWVGGTGMGGRGGTGGSGGTWRRRVRRHRSGGQRDEGPWGQRNRGAQGWGTWGQGNIGEHRGT